MLNNEQKVSVYKMPFPKSKLITSQDQSLPIINIQNNVHYNYYLLNNESLIQNCNEMKSSEIILPFIRKLRFNQKSIVKEQDRINSFLRRYKEAGKKLNSSSLQKESEEDFMTVGNAIIHLPNSERRTQEQISNLRPIEGQFFNFPRKIVKIPKVENFSNVLRIQQLPLNLKERVQSPSELEKEEISQNPCQIQRNPGELKRKQTKRVNQIEISKLILPLQKSNSQKAKNILPVKDTLYHKLKVNLKKETNQIQELNNKLEYLEYNDYNDWKLSFLNLSSEENDKEEEHISDYVKTKQQI